MEPSDGELRRSHYSDLHVTAVQVVCSPLGTLVDSGRELCMSAGYKVRALPSNPTLPFHT